MEKWQLALGGLVLLCILALMAATWPFALLIFTIFLLSNKQRRETIDWLWGIFLYLMGFVVTFQWLIVFMCISGGWGWYDFTLLTLLVILNMIVGVLMYLSISWWSPPRQECA